MLFNPTSDAINSTIPVDLYYTGLTTTAEVKEQGGSGQTLTLARDYSIDLA